MSVNGSVSAAINVRDQRTIGVNDVPVSVGPTFSVAGQITNGTGANQANRTWHAVRTIPTGGNDDLDLAGGLTDLQTGGAITFTSIISVAIKNRSATATLTIGGGTNTVTTILPGTSTVVLRPGGFVVLYGADATGYAVVAATGDILRISGTVGQQYDIVIIGRI